MTREEKVQALFQDEKVFQEVFVGDTDQILANLAARGIEMNEQELGELASGLVAGMGITEDELSEDALENVAGGAGLISGTIIKKMFEDVGNAVKGGIAKGRADKKNKTAKSVDYVESANTKIGKGWRAIGVTIGYYL